MGRLSVSHCPTCTAGGPHRLSKDGSAQCECCRAHAVALGDGAVPTIALPVPTDGEMVWLDVVPPVDSLLLVELLKRQHVELVVWSGLRKNIFFLNFDMRLEPEPAEEELMLESELDSEGAGE